MTRPLAGSRGAAGLQEVQQSWGTLRAFLVWLLPDSPSHFSSLQTLHKAQKENGLK